jgi:uncharacterized membrane protein
VTSVDILRFLHFASLFLMMGGLGAVMIPMWQAWRETDVGRQMIAFEDVLRGHRTALLPGTIAVAVTGVFLGIDAGYNFITDYWLLVLTLLHLFLLFVCIPVLGHSLNRIHLETLRARKKGSPTRELQEMMDDNVPIVFSLLILFLVPVMIWLPVFRPF